MFIILVRELGINNQHLYLQHHVVNFVPASGGKTDQPGYFSLQIHNDSYSSANLCPLFYMKAHLCCLESFRKKLDGSFVTSLFFGNNRQCMPVCAKMIYSWVRKVLSIAKAHVWEIYRVLQCLPLWWLEFAWCPSSRQVTGPEFLPQLDTFFNMYHYYRLASGLCARCCPGC